MSVDSDTDETYLTLLAMQPHLKDNIKFKPSKCYSEPSDELKNSKKEKDVRGITWEYEVLKGPNLGSIYHSVAVVSVLVLNLALSFY